MGELPGQNEELALLRSSVEKALSTADPKLRKALIRELFTQEFGSSLSPKFQQELQYIIIKIDKGKVLNTNLPQGWTM